MLVMTSAGQRLNPSAAASYEALNKAFTARFGKRLNISSGARTYEEQVTIFTTNNQLTPIRWSNGQYITRKWQGRTWYLKPGYATAAVPGTSNHEDPPGRAADFGSGVQTRYSAEHNWMLANAGNYGWEWTGRTFVTIEPWHWEKTLSWSGGGGSTTPEEDDMPTMSEFLNYPAYDGGPTISTFFKNVDQGGIATQVWHSTKVRRPEGDFEALQELADTKSILLQLRASQAGLEAAIQALANAKGLDASAILEAAQRGVENALKKVSFTAEIAE